MDLTDSIAPRSDQESWRAVVGYEGSYEVSDLGRVRALARLDALGRHRSAKLLRPRTQPSGHKTVALYASRVRDDVLVHHLVLTAFVGPRPGRPFRIVDVKTTGGSAHPLEFARAAAKFEYCMQGAQYIAGAKACGLDDNPEFVLIVVETAAPYLVSVVQFDEYDLQIGAEKIAEAVNIYRGCVESGVWPGYSSEIETMEMPAWYRIAHEQANEEEMSL